MLVLFKNIPIMLLWKILKVFKVSFRYYHLQTSLLSLYSLHLLNLPLKLQFAYLFNFRSTLEDCLNPQYCRRRNTSMKFQKGKSKHITIEYKYPIFFL